VLFPVLRRIGRLWWRPSGWRGDVIRLRRQAVMLQVLFVPIPHLLLLPVQTLSSPIAHRQGLYQDVVAELGPHAASGWVILWSVRKHWLHFFLGRISLKRRDPGFQGGHLNQELLDPLAQQAVSLSYLREWYLFSSVSSMYTTSGTTGRTS